MPHIHNNGVKIYYEVEGVGPALILLHGSTQDLLHWREFGWTDQLKQDYQLVLIDIRGHGASDKPHDSQAYRLELLAQDVLSVMDMLGIHQAHCCGFSLGGFIAFQLAKLADHRFHSFVIIGGHPYGMPGAGEEARSSFNGEMEELLDYDISPGLLMTPHFRAQKLTNDPQALFAAIFDDWPSNENVLPTMTMPCLVCVGEGGDFYDEAKKCAECLPNAKFRSFPGLTHGQMLRYSWQVAPYVKHFLDEVTPKSERNRTVIDRLVQTINRGNFLALNEFYTPDWVCLSSNANSDNKGIRELMDALFNVFGDAEVDLNDINVEDEQVTTSWTFKGTHTGEWMGIAPIGARVKISGVTIDRFRDGRIAESSHDYDLAKLRQQLTTSSGKLDS